MKHSELDAGVPPSLQVTGVSRRQLLERRLAEAQQELFELAIRVQNLRAVVQGLAAARHNAAHATFLLTQAIGLTGLHEAYRDWLQRELSTNDEHHPKDDPRPVLR